MHKIISGTPIPPKNKRNGYAYTLRLMAQGDDVFMPNAKTDNIRSLIGQMQRRGELKDARFTLRAVSGGAHVWRLTDPLPDLSA